MKAFGGGMDIAQRAIDAIGTSSSDDWILEPQNHAKTLPAEARLLREVLEDPELQAIIRTYNRYDEDANRAQRRYKFQAKGAAIASFLAIVALPIYFFMPDEAMNIVYFAQAALALLAAGLWLASSKGAFRRWVQSRAWAEYARINLFKAVLQKEESHLKGNEIPLLPLQLEYFRRYLLDSQRIYYGKRGEYFIRARSGSKRWATVVFAISALPILWETQERVHIRALDNLIATLPPKHIMRDIFLGVAILAVGLEFLRTAYAAVSDNYRNAWLYPKTGDKLDALSKEPLKEARANALKNDKGAVMQFAESVEKELVAEQHKWIAMSLGEDKPIRVPA
jgi:hypothetical protein